MEKKIIDFVQECQNSMGSNYDLQQLEEIINQLISVIYFLIEQGQQTVEEEEQKIQSLQSQLDQLQNQYENALCEIDTLQKDHRKLLEDFSQTEENMVKKEFQLKIEKDDQLYQMKSSTYEMMKSLKIQQQYIENVKKQNQDQEEEIGELMKKIKQLKSMTNTELHSELIDSNNVTRVSIPDTKIDQQQTNFVLQEKQQSCSSIDLNFQQFKEINTQVNLQSAVKEQPQSIKYINCHSKNQSINWVKLATIAQTQQSLTQSYVDDEENYNGRLSKDLSTDCGPYFYTVRNPYKDFFELISQSVKLDLNQMSLYPIHVNSLYNKFIEEGIPFHQWYKKVKEFLLKQL